MRRKLCGGLLILAAVIAVPQATRAQSLTDVARAEEARRKKAKAPAKVYTNDDLKSAQSGEAVPAAQNPVAMPASGPAAADPAKPAPPKAPADQGAAKDEKYWKGRMTAARDALTHDQVLADALQSRVNALTHDFAATADPAQRAIVEQNRKTALSEMDRVNADIQKQTKAMADTQEEARRAGVPAGWLR
jgi:hypothetical protein